MEFVKYRSAFLILFIPSSHRWQLHFCSASYTVGNKINCISIVQSVSHTVLVAGLFRSAKVGIFLKRHYQSLLPTWSSSSGFITFPTLIIATSMNRFCRVSFAQKQLHIVNRGVYSNKKLHTSPSKRRILWTDRI